MNKKILSMVVTSALCIMSIAPGVSAAEQTTYLKDGTYTGTATVSKYGYTVTANTVISDGTVESVTFTTDNTSKKNEGYIEDANDGIASKYAGLDYDSFSNVKIDTVSGATYASKAMISAANSSITDSVTTEEIAEDTPTEDQPSVDNPTEDQPSVDDPTEDQPSVDDPTEDQPSADDPTEDTPAEVTVFADGVYTAQKHVSGGKIQTKKEYDVTTTVTIENGAVSSVAIESTAGSNCKKYSALAVAGMEHAYDGMTYADYAASQVDAVSSATITSTAIADAVDEALASAVTTITVDPADPSEDQPSVDDPTEDQPSVDDPTEDQPSVDDPTEDTPTEVTVFADGVYTAQKHVSGGKIQTKKEYDVTVTVTIENGAVSSVVIKSTAGSNCKKYSALAVAGMEHAYDGMTYADYAASQVDAVSSATITSTAISDAVNEALQSAITVTVA